MVARRGIGVTWMNQKYLSLANQGEGSAISNIYRIGYACETINDPDMGQTLP